MRERATCRETGKYSIVSKRLIVCADGTWNKVEKAHSGKHLSTNVSKLAAALLPRDIHGTAQLLCYLEGAMDPWNTKRSDGVPHANEFNIRFPRVSVTKNARARSIRSCITIPITIKSPSFLKESAATRKKQSGNATLELQPEMTVPGWKRIHV